MTKIEQFNTQKRKGTLPKIASPAKKNKSDAEFSDDTSHIEKEKGVNDRNDDEWIKFNEDKEPVLPDDTAIVEMEGDTIEKKMKVKKKWWGKRGWIPKWHSPAEIEECIGDRNEDNNGDNHEVKEAECLVDTFTDVMDEDVSDKKNEKNENNYERKKLNVKMTPPLDKSTSTSPFPSGIADGNVQDGSSTLESPIHLRISGTLLAVHCL